MFSFLFQGFSSCCFSSSNSLTRRNVSDGLAISGLKKKTNLFTKVRSLIKIIIVCMLFLWTYMWYIKLMLLSSSEILTNLRKFCCITLSENDLKLKHKLYDKLKIQKLRERGRRFFLLIKKGKHSRRNISSAQNFSVLAKLFLHEPFDRLPFDRFKIQGSLLVRPTLSPLRTPLQGRLHNHGRREVRVRDWCWLWN